MEKEFEKIYGISERRDEITRRGTEWYLYYGQGEDSQGKYVCRKVYDHKPTQEEVAADITALINSQVEETILEGLQWQGHKVWLSAENQRNYSAIATLSDEDSTFPVVVKLGTDGDPVKVTFQTKAEYLKFYGAVVKHIRDTVSEGWKEKEEIPTMI